MQTNGSGSKLLFKGWIVETQEIEHEDEDDYNEEGVGKDGGNRESWKVGRSPDARFLGRVDKRGRCTSGVNR